MTPEAQGAVERAAEVALADLIERCQRSEVSLTDLAADHEPTTHEHYRLRGKRDGVALVRGYLEETVRHLRLHTLATPPTASHDEAPWVEWLASDDGHQWAEAMRRQGGRRAVADLRAQIEAAIGAHSFGLGLPEWKTENHNGAHDVIRVDVLRRILAARAAAGDADGGRAGGGGK